MRPAAAAHSAVAHGPQDHALPARPPPARPPPARRYTHLMVVLQGFARLMQQLFGLSLTITPGPPSEVWAPGVLKCEARHPDHGMMGTLYLDLCSRPGKYPSAVTFPIRCGRQLGSGYQVMRACGGAAPSTFGARCRCCWVGTHACASCRALDFIYKCYPSARTVPLAPLLGSCPPGPHHGPTG